MDTPASPMTRREALGHLAMLTGALVGEVRPAMGRRRPSPARAREVDVAIIGGGLAGLSAARRLQAAGLTVCVLEARARVGGRVHSTRLATGHVVDRGAQFVGADHRRLIALAAEARVSRTALFTTGQTLHVGSAGGPPTRRPRDATPLGWLGQLDAAQAVLRLGWAVDRLSPSDRARLDAQSAQAYIASHLMRDETFAAFVEPLANELCVPLDEISAYELLEQVRTIGGLDAEAESAQTFFPGGAAGVAEYLGRAIGDALTLNARVTRVSLEAGGVAVQSTTGAVRARRVVVAVPPQLYGDIGLLPLLPPHWRPALAGYRAGAAIKTMLVYDRPWWRAEGLSGTVASPSHPFSSMVDGSPPDGGAGVLVLFTTGQAARRLSGRTSEGDRVAGARQWVERVFGPRRPAPIAACSADWIADPLSLGGYASRRGIGGWSMAPDLFAARPPLHFAGTETATRWRSFMEGAITSGERAAAEVLGSATDPTPP